MPRRGSVDNPDTDTKGEQMKFTKEFIKGRIQQMKSDLANGIECRILTREAIAKFQGRIDAMEEVLALFGDGDEDVADVGSFMTK